MYLLEAVARLVAPFLKQVFVQYWTAYIRDCNFYGPASCVEVSSLFDEILTREKNIRLITLSLIT